MFIIDDIIFWGFILASAALLIYAVAMTAIWFKDKVKSKMAQKNVKKVAAGDLSKLINNCENQVSLDELEKYADEGYDNFVVAVDSNGRAVGDVELLQDTSSGSDMRKIYGREGMVVVNS